MLLDGLNVLGGCQFNTLPFCAIGLAKLELLYSCCLQLHFVTTLNGIGRNNKNRSLFDVMI